MATLDYVKNVKPRPHQQHCRSNIVECYKVECCFDKVERCFDIVAFFGNNVEATFDIVAKNCNAVKATGNKVASGFDNVAPTLLLVWTGLKVYADLTYAQGGLMYYADCQGLLALDPVIIMLQSSY